MNIGVIGTGNIGRTAAAHFVNAGHEVTLANSRGPESLAELVEELGPAARAGTVEEAARFGELAIEAVPFGEYDTLPAEALAGRVVVSAANYYPDRDGEVEFGDRTQTELVAEHLADSVVVKAFNTMYYETLRELARPDEPLEDRLVLFLAGDDDEATGLVADLIEEIGFAPVLVGPLSESGLVEPGSPLYNEPMRPPEVRERLAALEE